MSDPAANPAVAPAGTIRSRIPGELAGLAEGRTDKEFADIEKWVRQDAARLGRDEQFATLVGSGWPAPLMEWFLDQIPRAAVPPPPPSVSGRTGVGNPTPTWTAGELTRRLPNEIFAWAVACSLFAVVIPICIGAKVAITAPTVGWLAGLFAVFALAARSFLLKGRFGYLVGQLLALALTLAAVIVGIFSCFIPTAIVFAFFKNKTPIDALTNLRRRYDVARFFETGGACPRCAGKPEAWSGFLWTSYRCGTCQSVVKVSVPWKKTL